MECGVLKSFFHIGFLKLVSFSCEEAKTFPCYCLENQFKVSSPAGTIRCIPCYRTCQEEDCHSQQHQCENYKPFPQEEAYQCVEPKEN